MIIKRYSKRYKDYYIFITVHHSLTEVSVHSYIKDDPQWVDVYRNRYIDYSIDEIYDSICYQIDNNNIEQIQAH